MNKAFRIAYLVATSLLLAILLLLAIRFPSAFATQVSHHPTTNMPSLAMNYQQVRACKQRQLRNGANCGIIFLKPEGSQPFAFNQKPDGLTPEMLQEIYHFPSATNGIGETVAIIDAYDDPNAEADLATYRATFGLAPCTRENGCFQKVDEQGGKHYPSPDAGWAWEISLDLDMVSAICPNCHILLAEAKRATSDDLGRSVDTAVHLGATIVSNSYGIQETAQIVRENAHYYNHPGVIITASTGDSGYHGGVQFPADLKTVIAVGGTSVYRAKNNRGWIERAWSGAGSGCSQYVSKPSWQKDTGCSRRSLADVSAVADPETGVAIYNSYQSFGGWFVSGGTSAAAPIIAGAYALAGNVTADDASSLYEHTQEFNDVTEGSNGNCSTRYLCTGRTWL